MTEKATADNQAAAPSIQPMTGPEYFRRAIGEKHTPARYGKHEGAHPTTIRRVYEEALTRFPEAADVIAAMVFHDSVRRNRDYFLKEEDRHGE